MLGDTLEGCPGTELQFCMGLSQIKPAEGNKIECWRTDISAVPMKK